MISKRKLLDRIEALERETKLSVPVVDDSGEQIMAFSYWVSGPMQIPRMKKISFREVCRALQDMCDIEITYQEIPGKGCVVIYERDSDGGGQKQ